MGEEGGGKGKFRYLSRPTHPFPTLRTLFQPSTDQASNYNLKWRHPKPGLSSDAFQNRPALQANFDLSFSP